MYSIKNKLLIVLIFSGLLFSLLSCVDKEVSEQEIYDATEYRIEYKTEVRTSIQDVITKISGEENLIPLVQWDEPNLFIGGSSPVRYFAYKLPLYQTANVTIVIRNQANISHPPIVLAYDYSLTKQVPQYIGRIPYDQIIPGYRGYPNPNSYAPDITTTIGATQQEIDAFNQWLSMFNASLKAAKELKNTNPEVPLWMQSYESKIEYKYNVTGVTDLVLFIVGKSYYNEPIKSIVLSLNYEKTEKKSITQEVQVENKIPYQVKKQRTVTKIKQVPIWE